jgi:FMN reductase
MSNKGPIIAVVLGSTRPGNLTSRAAALVIDELRKDSSVTVDVIDPAVLTLSFPGHPLPGESSQDLQSRVRAASAVVLTTPEYHGTFSAVLKLVIENLGYPSALQGKPVALLGVAGGALGAIKSLEHLRGVCAHVGALALPMPTSVANVASAFDENGKCTDARVERHIRRAASNLLDYLHQNVCPRLTLERILREGIPSA